MAEEVRAHVAMMADDYEAQGMPRDEALRRASREFGNQLAIRERAVETWQFPRLESFGRDLLHGLRAIRRAPVFSGVILLTLALGIGATTAIFSVVYAVLIKPLPYPESDRLVWIGEAAGEATGISVTWGNFRAWQEGSTSFELLGGVIRGANRTLSGEGEPRVASGWIVSEEILRLAGFEAALGRVFASQDDRPDAAPTVVLSHEFWQADLGGSDVIGRLLTLDDRPYEVVGVLRPGSEFMEPDVDFYLPIGLFYTDSDPRGRHGSMRLVGRLAEGVTPARANADLDGILQRLAQSDPGSEDEHRAVVVPLSQQMRGDVGAVLWLLAGAVALVLVLACANVASLLLGRSVVRRREMAVRTAIGAGRGRLVRQLLTETIAIAAIGGAIGVALAHFGLAALVAAGPTGLPRLAEVGLDVPLLVFAAGLTGAVGFVAGLAPLGAARQPITSLKEGATAVGAGRSAQRARGVLVVAEVAVTVILAFASTLLVRSLAAAQGEGVGFDASGLLSVELRLPSGNYPDEPSRLQFYESFTSRLEARPGIDAAAAMGCPPMWGNCGDWWYSIEGQPAPVESEVPVARFDHAQAGTFATLGVPLRAGREFTSADRDGRLIAVINKALADRWWQSPADAIGETIKIGGPYQEGPAVEIVGVVGNASQSSPDAEAVPGFWLPLTTGPGSRMVVLVRGPADPATLVSTVRAELAEMDPRLPIWSIRPFSEVVSETLDGRRFTTGLLTLFAGLATLLAVVGVYGVIQQWVSSRRNEIAIRIVLGARKEAIARWAGGQASRLLGAGLALGVLGAVASARLLEGVVYGVSAWDPITLVAATLGVVLLAAGGAAVPIVRAMRVDPGGEIETG